jgi:glycosyltransferase involved in cell wall biosynthesis
MKVLVLTNMWPAPGRPQFGSFVARQVEELRTLGLDVDVLFVDGQSSKWNYLRGFRELHRTLKRERYDLIHAHYVFSGVIARSQKSCPIVLTHHGIETVQSWQAPLCWVVSRVVDAVTVVSPDLADKLGLDDAVVLPNGIDLDLFEPRSQHEARSRLGLNGRKIVLFVGEPRPEKRLDLIRAAAAKLESLRPDVLLLEVCGKPQAEIALYMNAADVLVLASDFEGDPMVIKEAMATNLPIVTTAVGALRDVVAGTDGCFVAEQSVTDISEKLERALERGGRTNGRTAIARYSWPHVARDVLAVYERVIARRG